MSVTKPTAGIIKAMQEYADNEGEFLFYGWELYFHLTPKQRSRFERVVQGYRNAERDMS